MGSLLLYVQLLLFQYAQKALLVKYMAIEKLHRSEKGLNKARVKIFIIYFELSVS